MKKKLTHGIKVEQVQEIFRFRVNFIANGIESTGLAIGESEEDVRNAYNQMNSEKESMVVIDVKLEN